MKRVDEPDRLVIAAGVVERLLERVGAEKGDVNCMKAIERLNTKVTIDEQDLAKIRAVFDQANDGIIKGLLATATNSDKVDDLWAAGNWLADGFFSVLRLQALMAALPDRSRRQHAAHQ